MNNPFETIDARLSNIENLLLDLKHYAPTQQAQAEPQPDLIGIKEAASLLGWKVATIYTKSSKRTLPFPCMKKSGMKQLFFSRAKILSYRNSMGLRKSKKEIKEEAIQAQVKK